MTYKELHERIVRTGGEDWFVDLNSNTIHNFSDIKESDFRRYGYYFRPRFCSSVGPIILV